MSRAPRESLPPEGFAELLGRKAPTHKPPLTGGRDWRPLGSYLAELDRWRGRMNLTGRLTAGDLADHALESLLGSDLISHGERVIDIGSGGGFPGLPLAIARPDLSMVLSEPRAKRAAFLRHVVRELRLENAEVLQGRIRDVGGQTFDAATLRAVGDPEKVSADWGFLRPGGALIAWTTRPEAWATALAPRFSLERRVPVPGTRHREVALFRLA